MILLLRGRLARRTALCICALTALVLTLPVAPHYVEMALWYVGLFTHQGGYGSGAVGVPSFSDLAADAATLIAKRHRKSLFAWRCTVWRSLPGVFPPMAPGCFDLLHGFCAARPAGRSGSNRKCATPFRPWVFFASAMRSWRNDISGQIPLRGQGGWSLPHCWCWVSQAARRAPELSDRCVSVPTKTLLRKVSQKRLLDRALLRHQSDQRI